MTVLKLDLVSPQDRTSLVINGGLVRHLNRKESLLVVFETIVLLLIIIMEQSRQVQYKMTENLFRECHTVVVEK